MSSLPTISPVQGVILEEMRLYVVNEFGEAASSRVLERSGRAANHQYDPDQAYSRGVIRGAAAHYGVEIAITENYCVLRGDAACVFTVEGSND